MRGRGRRIAVMGAYVVAWALLALVASIGVFLQSDRSLTLASHDATAQPDFTGRVVLRTGPVLPDVRVDSGSVFGLNVILGKTDAASTDELLARYALIASQPDGPVAKIDNVIEQLLLDAVIKGAILGSIPVFVWVLIGAGRRRELARRLLSRQGAGGGVVVVLVLTGLWAPWEPDEDTLEGGSEWVSLESFLGPAVVLPDEARGIEVLGDVTTVQTKRLIASAVDSYDKSLTFYATAEEAAADLDLRDPEAGETVVALVSDRHDNVGMDPVARAIADAGGATAVFDVGDDTSTGRTWEAFSLDSVTAAFDDYDDRWGVAGNHDNGVFVSDYLAERGWTMLAGEAVDGPAGSRLLGVDDPRSSGLGAWRDEVGLSFEEVGSRLADAACAADEDGERVATVLVHDANLGDETLERGCADLVVGGHLHVQEGPTAVTGDNGAVGHSFTTGTTGGAAYAIAVGSKIRRPAQVTLITYAEGRPVGLQPVTLQTNGRFDVSEFVELAY